MKFPATSVSAQGLELIKSEEGFMAHVYRDPVGVETVGYGTTSAVVGSLPESVTEQEATALLLLDLERTVYPAIKGCGVSLRQTRFDALCDLAYNLGAGILGEGHTMGQLIRKRPWDPRGIAEAFLLYDHAGGEVLPGLRSRRERERELWLAGRYG